MFGATLETLRFPKENRVYNRITVTQSADDTPVLPLALGWALDFLNRARLCQNTT